MTFYNQHLLILLILIPIALIIAMIGYRNRSRRLRELISISLWSVTVPSLNPNRRFWKRALLLTAFTLLIISFLRPQYGLKLETRERKGQDIFIALDTSMSMYSRDTLPSRFTRAKQEIKGLIENLKGDRVGLIVFSGNAFIQCPLTTDYHALHMFLDDISIGSAGTPGTDIATAIKVGRMAFNRQSQNKNKILIVISDGESFENDPVESAKVALKDGLTIFTIGIGTPAGEPIPTFDENGIKKGFKKDKSGSIIVSQLNESLLKEIASTTNGLYFHSHQGSLAIDQLYRIISKMDASILSTQQREYKIDRYYWFLIPAFIFLILEFILNERNPLSNPNKQ
jgi:Ca-activated chloride channel family protein